MAGRAEAIEAYVRAYCSGDQTASDAAAQFLAPDVDLVSPPLHVRGRAGVVERITGHWPGMGMYATAAWSPVQEEGDVATITGEMAPDLPTKAVRLSFTFNDQGEICHVEAAATRGNPPPPGDVCLTDEIKHLVNNSLDDGCPMVVGYMGPDGQPQLSLRGSMRALSDTQLAFWVRNPNGGIVKALDDNPRITVLYRDTPNRVNLLFQGRGRVETDEAIRNAVFESMPQIEQDHDEPRRGACMVVDLESVSGATLAGPVRMQRKARDQQLVG